jgi:tetratricopeptide (TPR) repeat protein
VANCYSNIGVNYYCQKDYPQALEYLNKSIAIKEKTEVAPDNLAEIYSFRASIEEKSGNQPAALESYMKSYTLLLTVKPEDDMDLVRAFYAVYDTFLQLTQGQQADIFRQRFHAFMADKVFCGVVQEGGPAHRAGLSGTFVYLAFNGEPVNAGGFEKNFFQIVGQAREQPKTVVAERDGTIMEKHFDGPLGCMNMVRTIAPAEKQALLQRYEQWKAAGQQ